MSFYLPIPKVAHAESEYYIINPKSRKCNQNFYVYCIMNLIRNINGHTKNYPSLVQFIGDLTGLFRVWSPQVSFSHSSGLVYVLNWAVRPGILPDNQV